MGAFFAFYEQNRYAMGLFRRVSGRVLQMQASIGTYQLQGDRVLLHRKRSSCPQAEAAYRDHVIIGNPSAQVVVVNSSDAALVMERLPGSAPRSAALRWGCFGVFGVFTPHEWGDITD